jgi:pteridine reductase
MQKNQINTANVALITGAARRIGAEIARVLHDAGMNVVLHYYTSHVEAELLCATLNEKRPDSAITLAANLSEMTELSRLVERAVQKWDRLDVLVNNASRFYRTALADTTESAWDDLLTSNLKAPFFLSQAAAPHLAKQQGCIINLADIRGERPMRDYSAYCVSKAGLIMLTKSLAKELGPKVRVNAVSPGSTMWPEGENTLSAVEQQNILDRTILQYGRGPEAVAKAVLFLINESSFITGQVLAVDGGRSLMI